MTNENRWDAWYEGMTAPAAYGDQMSYALAADFLKDCDSIEDWGCGKGWFKTLVPDHIKYVGVDGSHTPFADVHADLVKYRSTAEGVLLRHVLEHNYEWAKILDNAVASATKKLCVILFTPLVSNTKEVAYTEEIGVPDISFHLPDITTRMRGFGIEVDHLKTATQYGEETMIYGST